MPDTTPPPPAAAPTTAKPGTPATLAGPVAPMPQGEKLSDSAKSGNITGRPKSYSEVGVVKDIPVNPGPSRDWPVLIIGWIFGLATSVLVAVRVAKITNHSADERAKKDRSLALKKNLYLSAIEIQVQNAMRFRALYGDFGPEWKDWNPGEHGMHLVKLSFINSEPVIQACLAISRHFDENFEVLLKRRRALELTLQACHFETNSDSAERLRESYQIGLKELKETCQAKCFESLALIKVAVEVMHNDL